MHGILTDIGITVIVAAGVVVLITRLKQPLLLGYLITGVIIGPEIGPKMIHDPESIEVISEIGLVLLLFIIGLEMNPQQLIAAGKKIIIPGLLQFPISVITGLGFFYFFNLAADTLTSLYLAIFCSLGSTAIVVKVLYDKFEMDALYGRITIGILIFQDIWAILVLALQPNFSNPELSAAAIALGKSFGLLAVGFLLSRFVLKTVYGWIYRSPEMTIIISIGWCAFMAATGGLIDLSMEMGALIAGVSISTFPYSIHVTARVSMLRDFFLSLFFVSLGMKIPMPEISLLVSSLFLILFLFISRLITIYPLMRISGSSSRTSFLATLTLAQISEFSLVIASVGVGLKHIGKDELAVVLYAMSVTAVLSSYMIKYNYNIYNALSRLLGQKPAPGKEQSDHQVYPIVVLGMHRGAREMLNMIADLNPELTQKILVIDFNLESLKELQPMKTGTLFGDISSMETLEHAHLDQAKIILSTIPDMLLKGTSNEQIIQMCRSLAPNAFIVATAESDTQANVLKKAGAGKVLLPYSMMGESLADFLLMEGSHHL